MSKALIKLENVSKKFCRTIKHTMLYGVSDLTKSFFGADQKTSELRNSEFWSVDNVSFELNRGECLGLIGPNGAGKSTLLKMLNGIFMPDKGSIEINGRVGALIEVGAGFHPMLTGRENVYINGTILGLSKKEINRKFDEIVDFAEIEDFIDSPVKFYSSGMHVRLGFAIAAQMRPDILLIDEVLAVGDVGFRAKCYDFIANIMNDAAILFVSHSMPQVSRICNRLVVMDEGNTIYNGETAQGIESYYSAFQGERNIIAGSGRAEIKNIKLLNSSNCETDSIEHGESLIIEFETKIDRLEPNPSVSITLASQELQVVAQCHSKYNRITLKHEGKTLKIRVILPDLYLNPGTYLLSMIIFNENGAEHMAWHHTVKKIRVNGNFFGGAPYQVQGIWQIL